MPYADDSHAASGLWTLSAVGIETFVVALRTRRYDLKLNRWYPCGQELALIGSREAHRPGSGRIPVPFVGLDESLPIGEPFLEGAYAMVVQVMAARAYGWSEQGVQSGRIDAKLPFDDAECSANNEMEGSHAPGMHDRNKRGMQGVEDDGEAVGGENTEGRVGQRRHQRIGLDTGEAVWQRHSINDAHPVSVYLAHRVER